MTPNEFELALFHEAIHAFQYRYRFGLDVVRLSQLIKDPRQLVNDLGYFYETQAHWYTISTLKDQRFMEKMNSRIVRYDYARGPLVALDALTGFVGHLFIRPVILPVYETPDLFLGFRATLGSTEKLLGRELIVQKRLWAPKTVGFVHAGLAAHKYISERIEEAYFGDLPRILDGSEADQATFVQLHNQFFERIIENHDLMGEQCAGEIDFLSGGDEAPYIRWQKLPAHQTTCSVYASVKENTLSRFDFWLRMMAPIDISPGSEGTKPDISFFSIIPIQPQIRLVTP